MRRWFTVSIGADETIGEDVTEDWPPTAAVVRNVWITNLEGVPGDGEVAITCTNHAEAKSTRMTAPSPPM